MVLGQGLMQQDMLQPMMPCWCALCCRCRKGVCRAVVFFREPVTRGFLAAFFCACAFGAALQSRAEPERTANQSPWRPLPSHLTRLKRRAMRSSRERKQRHSPVHSMNSCSVSAAVLAFSPSPLQGAVPVERDSHYVCSLCACVLLLSLSGILVWLVQRCTRSVRS